MVLTVAFLLDLLQELLPETGLLRTPLFSTCMHGFQKNYPATLCEIYLSSLLLKQCDFQHDMKDISGNLCPFHTHTHQN